MSDPELNYMIETFGVGVDRPIDQEEPEYEHEED